MCWGIVVVLWIPYRLRCVASLKVSDDLVAESRFNVDSELCTATCRISLCANRHLHPNSSILWSLFNKKLF